MDAGVGFDEERGGGFVFEEADGLVFERFGFDEVFSDDGVASFIYDVHEPIIPNCRGRVNLLYWIV